MAARSRASLASRSTASYRRLQSKCLAPGPARVIDAIRTCRLTCQDKIWIDLALERLTLLADHRQLTLWIDIALKIKSSRRKNSALEGGKTIPNGQSATGDKIGAPGGHVPGDSISVISIKGPGCVAGRSRRRGPGRRGCSRLGGVRRLRRWLRGAGRNREERYPQHA